MPRSINQVERKFGFPILTGSPFHLYSMTLNGNTPFTLKIHIIKDLILHVLLFDSIGNLKHAVSKCTFAVIDVRNDAKIPYLIHNRVQKYEIFRTYAKNSAKICEYGKKYVILQVLWQ